MAEWQGGVGFASGHHYITIFTFFFTRPSYTSTKKPATELELTCAHIRLPFSTFSS